MFYYDVGHSERSSASETWHLATEARKYTSAWRRGRNLASDKLHDCDASPSFVSIRQHHETCACVTVLAASFSATVSSLSLTVIICYTVLLLTPLY